MGDGHSGSRDDEPPEPPRLRQLRWLVNALTLTLIAGVLVIAATLVIRLGAAPPPPPPLPTLPEAVVLPAGERVRAVTFGAGWVAAVTVDAEGLERIRVWDGDSGAERASLPIPPVD